MVPVIAGAGGAPGAGGPASRSTRTRRARPGRRWRPGRPSSTTSRAACWIPTSSGVAASAAGGDRARAPAGRAGDHDGRGRFADVVSEVGRRAEARIAAARAAGCTEVWADPGIGFGKRTAREPGAAGRPARAGGALARAGDGGRLAQAFPGRADRRRRRTNAPFGDGGRGGAAVLGGAAAVRVHDVAAMQDVVRVAAAIASAR